MNPTILLACDGPFCSAAPFETEVRYHRCSEDDPYDVEWVPVYEGEQFCPDCGLLMEEV